ncbi:hypothetical protein Ade02nite_51560 [Paractinoplanes deccanensis]|uniref:Uncharacterized protein n=1 Tax=Paractinoplanes deccanensis TaxID=113561 RepID=A0ABQ3Y9K3_9ACTN|nr:hypothetical protein Ade02nite_51560 [Actinoplanes deccanensis]
MAPSPWATPAPASESTSAFRQTTDTPNDWRPVGGERECHLVERTGRERRGGPAAGLRRPEAAMVATGFVEPTRVVRRRGGAAVRRGTVARPAGGAVPRRGRRAMERCEGRRL